MSDGWWLLLLFMYISDKDFMARTDSAITMKDANEKFEAWAKDCPYLEVEQNSNVYEHICHHPDRDDSTVWVMCDKRACPYIDVANHPHYCQLCSMLSESE